MFSFLLRVNEKHFWPPGLCYHYEVEIIESKTKSDNVAHVSGSKLRRKKSTYTRERNYLFIKHFVAKIDGIWKLKDNAYQRFDIGKVKFDEIFAGHVPKFQRSDTPKKVVKKSSLNLQKSPHKIGIMKKQESLDKYLKPKITEKESKSKRGVISQEKKHSKESIFLNKDGSGSGGGSNYSKTKQVYSKKSTVKRKSTEEILEQELLEKRKKMMEHQQQLIEKKQQKQLDIQRKKDEKKKLEEFMREWHKTREDLELEDLKELPSAIPISLNIPNEHFGELVMLYEFFQTFFEQINVKNFFPAGVTIDLLDRALSQQEIAGPFFDFINLLLGAIFKLQEEEEDEIGETYDSFAINEFDNVEMVENNKTNWTSFPVEINVASMATNWPIVFQGVPLQKLPIDATTVTEVLRLHLLTSGSRVSEACNRWRIQEKGGYCYNDDPAVTFRIENPHIMKFISEKSIANLPVIDKISILQCLVNQIVMFAPIRDIINENVENCRHKRIELRLALAAELKKEKELMQKKKEKKIIGGEKSSSEKICVSNSVLDSSNLLTSENDSTQALEKAEKEIEKRKEDLKKQLADTVAENMKVQLEPIGLDRAYRRYWLFPSIPGIFIEDNEQNPPSCLPRGTPKPNLALMKEKDTSSYIRKLFQKEYNKENFNTAPLTSSPQKGCVIRYSNMMATNSAATAISNDSMSNEESNKVPFSCWGNNETCPIHCRSVFRLKWSYYRTEDDYENLINALNTRGKRESKLRMTLNQYRESILKNLTRPFVNLNKSKNPDEESGKGITEIRKSSRGNPTYENAMFDFPPDTDVEKVLESSLRDIILEIEEKTNAGGLGCLKVSYLISFLTYII